jgi:hypothetical protein
MEVECWLAEHNKRRPQQALLVLGACILRWQVSMDDTPSMGSRITGAVSSRTAAIGTNTVKRALLAWPRPATPPHSKQYRPAAPFTHAQRPTGHKSRSCDRIAATSHHLSYEDRSLALVLVIVSHVGQRLRGSTLRHGR